MALYTIIVYIPEGRSGIEGWRLLGDGDSDELFCQNSVWTEPAIPNKKAAYWNKCWNKDGYFYEVIEL